MVVYSKSVCREAFVGIHLIPIPFIIVLIIYYKIYREKNDLKKVGIIQTLITCLDVVVCILSYLTPGFSLSYTLLVLLGLGLAIVADLNFVEHNDYNMKNLTVTLVMFLFIYMSYSAAITLKHGFLIEDLYFVPSLLLIVVLSLAYLWKGLNGLRIPILIYLLILCFFLSRSISTFFGSGFAVAQSIMLTAAASMFFIGDLELAIGSFKKPLPRYIRVDYIGPVTYALAQTLMALSTCYFPHS
jgi:uncharacterized membrane protein YhhN